MSVNSLLTNPEIIDELINKINAVQPKKAYTNLSNSDGNLTVSNTPTQGSISFATEAQTNIINTPKTTSEFIDNTNLIESDINKISFTEATSTISINNTSSSIYLDDNQNLQLIQTKLKNINMINPYDTDGTNGEILSSDGQGGIKWQNNNAVNTLRYLFSDYKQLVSATSNSEGYLLLYTTPLISGFEIGKRINIVFSFTHFETIRTTDAFSITATINNIQQTVNANFGDLNYHTTRTVNFSFINQQENQTVAINLQILPQEFFSLLSVDPGDYVSILIYEI